METKEIFSQALQISSPYQISDIRFERNTDGQDDLHIYISYARGSEFADSTGALCGMHDSKPRTWQHLNFFQHKCYLHCRVPRIKCTDGKVRQVEVDWARAESGFTLLFECHVMSLIRDEMTISRVAARFGVYDKRIWRIFNHWVAKALTDANHAGITTLGVDETSRKRGHNYVTLAVDLTTRRVVFVTEGKDAATLKATASYLESKGSPCDKVTDVSIDLSPAFISGVGEHFSKAAITFDKFHVKKLVNEAMDRVRRAEAAGARAYFKGQRYVFLKNSGDLSEKQHAEKERLTAAYPTVGEAYRLKTIFDELWTKRNKEEADIFLSEWCLQATMAAIEPFTKLVATLQKHRDGILNYLQSHINNGILEGINSKVQLAKKRARGFRNIDNFINMIYFNAGKLDFSFPH